ncbi:unnamed protein product, partial [Mesorhabditis spiculigera]
MNRQFNLTDTRHYLRKRFCSQKDELNSGKTYLALKEHERRAVGRNYVACKNVMPRLAKPEVEKCKLELKDEFKVCYKLRPPVARLPEPSKASASDLEQGYDPKMLTDDYLLTALMQAPPVQMTPMKPSPSACSTPKTTRGSRQWHGSVGKTVLMHRKRDNPASKLIQESEPERGQPLYARRGIPVSSLKISSSPKKNWAQYSPYNLRSAQRNSHLQRLNTASPSSIDSPSGMLAKNVAEFALQSPVTTPSIRTGKSGSANFFFGDTAERNSNHLI